MIFHYFLCFMAERNIIYDKVQNRFLKISEEGDPYYGKSRNWKQDHIATTSCNDLVVNLIHVN